MKTTLHVLCISVAACALQPPVRRAAPRTQLAASGNADAAAPARTTKRDMLKFYGPALGIFMASPLMSNIDNAIVGRAAGVGALAALSPGTVLSDQVLFLFSFLGRATTGLVARAYAVEGAAGAKRELRRPLALAFAIGAGVLAPLYLFGTHAALDALRVDPSLRADAAAYATIRGVAAPLALCQSVALSALLAARDAVTPLKVVLGAALLNFVGDWVLCVWPLRLGVRGAAAATSLATAAGCVFMVRALRRRDFLDADEPWYRDYFLPGRQRRQTAALRRELGPLLAYAGPLSAIVLARLLGFAAMQVTAASFGTAALAAYQVLLSFFVLFAFFAEPLSQTAQALVPPLVDARRPRELRRVMKDLAILAGCVGPLVACACAACLAVGAPAFVGDATTVGLVRAAAFPAVFATVLQLTLTTTLDGCMVGARDFKWIVALGTCTCVCQLRALRWIADRGAGGALGPELGLALLFSTFTARLLAYAAISSLRVLLGFGPLGRAARDEPS